MPTISTNAIRAFADKVRTLSMTNSKTLSMSQQEAKNLNHEIQQLMALIIESNSQPQDQGNTTLEIRGGRW